MCAVYNNTSLGERRINFGIIKIKPNLFYFHEICFTFALVVNLSLSLFFFFSFLVFLSFFHKTQETRLTQSTRDREKAPKFIRSCWCKAMRWSNKKYANSFFISILCYLPNRSFVMEILFGAFGNEKFGALLTFDISADDDFVARRANYIRNLYTWIWFLTVFILNCKTYSKLNIQQWR